MRSSWQTHARSVHKMQSQSRQRAPQRPSKRRSVSAEKDKKEATGKELMATLEFISSLHAECDWPVQYSRVRKEGRAGEVESIQKAKAVLSGSDYSLIRTVKPHVRSQQDPKGPGHPEPVMGGACAECAKHAPYLNRKDQCVCFATDIMGTFADDATKQLTTRTKYGFETVNTGAERQAEERRCSRRESLSRRAQAVQNIRKEKAGKKEGCTKENKL